MSDTPLSPAEQQANAARMLAEARKFAAEAEIAEKTARIKAIELTKAEEAEKSRKATDEHNHVYRFDGAVSDGSVKSCITKLTEWHRLDPDCAIEIIFSSPGGGIISGMELFDYIIELGKTHKVTTGATGMAASMAGILVQAGQTRWASKQCWYLIHRAAFGAVGKTFEIEDEVKFVKRIEERIIDIFTSRSKLTRAKIKRNCERKDWWLNTEELLELGLIDEVKAEV